MNNTIKQEKIKNIIFYIFGTSDLYIDNICFGKDKDGNFIKDFNFNNELTNIKNNIKDYSISFPIFDKMCEGFSENESYEFIGIYTKQEIPFRTDTYKLQSIINDYIAKKYSSNIKKSKSFLILTEAQKSTVIFNQISDFIKNIKNYIKHTNRYIINLTSGTKGMVLGLFQATLSILNIQKIQFIVINENENKQIDFINIKNSIMLKNIISNLKLLSSNYDFIGIYNFIQNLDYNNNIINNELLKIKSISEYTFNLLDFNIEKSQTIANEIENTYGFTLPFYDIENYDKGDKIKLALDGILYTLYTNRYTELFGRLYSFSDILLSQIIYININKNIETYKELQNYTENENRELQNFLNKYKIDNNKLEWKESKQKELNLFVKKAILEFLIYDGFNNSQIYLDFVNKITKLTSYRNKTIIAHGTMGISEEKIQKHFEGDLISEIKELYIKLKFGNTVFIDKIQNLLNEKILSLD